jgi:beta-glucosidase
MTREEWLKLSAAVAMGIVLPKGVLAEMLVTEAEIKASDFGKDFVWGTATAAYQIEGGWNEDGKGESIWDHFAHKPGKIKRHETADVGADFYHRYESDIALMKQMNIPASRFSVGWSRILPKGTGQVNQKGIDFYNRMIDSCLKNGVEPWLTCYHWDLPQALEDKGGWTNRAILGWFEEYVGLCAKSFGDRVKNWMVFNEPMAFTGLGYLLGSNAPGKMGFGNFYPAVHHATMCHGVGGRTLRHLLPKTAQIGTTFSVSHAEAFKNLPKNEGARRRVDALFNRLFIEPTLGMGYPVKDLPALKHLEKHMLPGDEVLMPFDFDFIGLQNYFRAVVKNFALVPALHSVNVPAKKLGNPITAMGWEVYPQGMYDIIKQFAAYPGVKSIYITENGTAFEDKVENGEVHDPQRTQYIKDYLKQVLRAKNEGVNLKGYFVWSFIDNFEWDSGYKPRFGIVYNDVADQKRIVKDSGKWYAEFLKK